MNPPWIEYPQFERHSMAWKMGGSEGYYNEFYRWFSRLTDAERATYAKEVAEPSEWQGFYKMIADNPWK